VDLREVAAISGPQASDNLSPAIAELIGDGLMQQDGNFIRLTPRGRLLSNEVFQAFLAKADVSTQA
jgi:coproporphyrinogen III oxidase-like Fe-S oxidoreductase